VEARIYDYKLATELAARGESEARQFNTTGFPHKRLRVLISALQKSY
jgi:hypothetical protein